MVANTNDEASITGALCVIRILRITSCLNKAEMGFCSVSDCLGHLDGGKDLLTSYSYVTDG